MQLFHAHRAIPVPQLKMQNKTFSISSFPYFFVYYLVMVGLLDNDALTGNSLQKPGNEAYDIVHVCMVSKIKLKKKKWKAFAKE